MPSAPLYPRSLAALGRSEFAIINTDNPEDLPVEHDLVLADKQERKLNLRVHYQCVLSRRFAGLALRSG
mgnify:CR=1 FL=1